LDREIRVGVPARRTDGSGRRTAGRWVAPPAVAAVRSSGLRVVGRDSLERDSGRSWEFLGALMTPRSPSAGSRWVPRRPPGRGSWGLSFSRKGHPHRAPAPGSATDHGGTRPAASAVPSPHRPPTRPRLSRPTCLHRWQPTWQWLPVARPVPGLSSPTTVLSRRYGESWLAGSWPGVAAVPAPRP
jgi:hypothetical protein